MEKFKIIVCTNEEKMRVLDTISKDNNLYNIKFMSKEEFINNYYFSYDESVIQYLMDKYNFNLDVCKVYLKNLYVIDINKNYKSTKLNFLKNLKKELFNNQLLIKNDSFKEYLKDKEITVKNYYDLEKYEEKALNYHNVIPLVDLNVDVVECDTLEDEVNNVCLNILNLLDKGVDINNIYLTNVSSEYLYTINRLFKYYNIPINLDMNYSIYSTRVVSDFLKTHDIDLESKDNYKITKKLINVINSLAKLDSSKDSYQKILIDKLKNTSVGNVKLNNAVNIKDFYKTTFKDSEYVFVLGFNQDILPKIEKDVDYINDSIKNEVDLYTTSYKNKRNKQVTKFLLSQIKNLFISYKKSSPFNNYYPSSLISDLNLNISKPIVDNFNYSNIYNILRLGEKLDLYYKYGVDNGTLSLLNSHYDIPYNCYSNSFSGIDNNIYLNSIKKSLNLSYSTLNDYSECGFKYYLKNVLNLNVYEEKFPNFIGNLFHKILSIYKISGFDLDYEFNKYIETRELTIKEKVLLIRLKKNLIELIESMKKQQLITGYDNEYLEKKLEIPLLNKKVSVIFKGFVDKIMYYENLEDTYYAIVDYKSGSVDTNIEPMKYGLHMQLPVYLYLIKYSHIFNRPKFCGIYYQNILFSYPNVDSIEEYKKNINDRLKLQGYSIDDISILERFDSTYTKSDYIKSMSYSEEKGFGTYSKIIDEDTLNNLIEYTKNYIDDAASNIIDSKFDIDPKYYNGKNVSCEFCEFKDICFMREKDLKYLEKVEDLSFLGGDL